MAKVRITAGYWAGQEGDMAADQAADADGRVVVRMPGNRLVEFAPEVVDLVIDDEPEAE
jgi:hypothetical protein